MKKQTKEQEIREELDTHMLMHDKHEDMFCNCDLSRMKLKGYYKGKQEALKQVLEIIGERNFYVRVFGKRNGKNVILYFKLKDFVREELKAQLNKLQQEKK